MRPLWLRRFTPALVREARGRRARRLRMPAVIACYSASALWLLALCEKPKNPDAEALWIVIVVLLWLLWLAVADAAVALDEA